MDASGIKDKAILILAVGLAYFSTKMLYAYYRKRAERDYEEEGESTKESSSSFVRHRSCSHSTLSSKTNQVVEQVVEDSVTSLHTSDPDNEYVTGNNLVVNMNDEILAANF